MIMGLGTALMEGIVFADGQVSNANLSDYCIPAAADLPRRMTHELIEREGAEVHGLGETALPPVPAAIGNALASLGLHVTELPITPERVLEAVDAAVKVSLVLNGRAAGARGPRRRDAARRAPRGRACCRCARRARSGCAAPAPCSSTASR